MLNQALSELYEHFPYESKLSYSDKFKPYRANVRLSNNLIQFNLSRKWKTISEDIQIGLIQELALKILKNRLKPITKKTMNMEMYNIFLRKLHLAIPKTKREPILEESFNRVNEKYFYGMIEQPNLVLVESVTKLGSYEYGSDTISITKHLLEDNEALDYVMYHEMLHKKHKFYTKNGRSFHHTTKFRDDEKEFENSAEIEKRLSYIVRKNKIKQRRQFFSWL